MRKLKPLSGLALATILFAVQVLGADIDMSDKGVGPVKSVAVPKSIDHKLVAKGKAAFEAKCTACHKIDERYVGPALKDVTLRRSPEWIMNMALNPAEMTQNDPIAKDLLSEYLTQMTFQNVTQDDVRAIVEYFRNNDSKPGGSAGKAASAPKK